jgi:hypothetical protein
VNCPTTVPLSQRLREWDSGTAFATVFGVSLRPDPVERAAQVGRLCGVAAMLLRSTHPIVPLLRRAERDDKALERALDVIGALPALTRRRLVASFGATQWACSRPRRPAHRESVDEPVGRFSDLER